MLLVAGLVRDMSLLKSVITAPVWQFFGTIQAGTMINDFRL